MGTRSTEKLIEAIEKTKGVALGYLVSFIAQIRHGQIGTFNRAGTVHRKTSPVSFVACALAAIACRAGSRSRAHEWCCWGTGSPRG